MDNLLPPSATPLERHVAATLAALGQLRVPLRDLWDPYACPIDLLPWLAWTVAIDDWDESWPEDVKRAAVADQVALHRRRGTVWAVKRAVRRSGLTAEIFERRQQRAIYEAYGTLQVDGSWQLDGTQKIYPVDLVTGIPHIQHWAQFIVRINLAEAQRVEAYAQARRLIEAWKPERSWPIYVHYLLLTIIIAIETRSRALIEKRSRMRYPWCGRVISDAPDASWRLGRDAEPIRLPQPFGSFRVGQMVGAVPGWLIHNCSIQSGLLAQLHGQATPVGDMTRLGDPNVRLDRTWRLSRREIHAVTHADMRSKAASPTTARLITTHHEHTLLPYPKPSPRLASGPRRLVPWHRLDGSWMLGEPLRKQSFGFRLGRDQSIPARGAAVIRLSSRARVSPERLARLRAVQIANGTHAHRIGKFRLGPDFSGAAYEPWIEQARVLRLDGVWRVGGPAAPHATIN